MMMIFVRSTDGYLWRDTNSSELTTYIPSSTRKWNRRERFCEQREKRSRLMCLCVVWWATQLCAGHKLHDAWADDKMASQIKLNTMPWVRPHLITAFYNVPKSGRSWLSPGFGGGLERSERNGNNYHRPLMVEWTLRFQLIYNSERREMTACTHGWRERVVVFVGEGWNRNFEILIVV